MSDFGKDFGLINEAKLTTVKMWGDRVRDVWAKIAHDKQFATSILHLFLVATKLVFRLNSTFDRDMSREGWKLKKDVELDPLSHGEFIPELVEFPVFGAKIQERIKDELLAGQVHLEAMLRNQAQIPVEWRKYILLAPGTVWQIPEGDQGTPYLSWVKGRWCLDFLFINRRFRGTIRVVRLGKYQK